VRRCQDRSLGDVPFLRHTYAKRFSRAGSSMGRDRRSTRPCRAHHGKEYAHLAPNYVADTVRAALPQLGVSTMTTVITLSRA